MRNIIAIRREDLCKKGEKRSAIVPEMVRTLTQQGAKIIVQPAVNPQTGERKRAFDDALYAQAGAEISEDISAANLIVGIKEIELEHILPDKTYLLFSHTHKGQKKNRQMLRTFMERRATVIDYELITDDDGWRQITAFTYFAGYAGMIDSLWTLGKRLTMEGIENPFAAIPQSIEKEDLALIKNLIRGVGEKITAEGTPATLPPIITAFLGGGKTSTGAQKIFDLLPYKEISIEELPEVFAHGDRRYMYKLRLHIADMYRYTEDDAAKRALHSKDEIAQEYKDFPERFESNMDAVYPYITLLMNCILWSPKYPRLITREQAKLWHAQHNTLKVIGDITCDPEGAIQFSRETWVDTPVFIYNPETEADTTGFEGDGIAVMAITNLPCEFSADASAGFCANLSPFLTELLSADLQAIEPQFAGLPAEIQRATILWRGNLTEQYRYMAQYVEGLDSHLVVS